MLGNRVLQVKMVKTTDKNANVEDAPEIDRLDLEYIHEIARDVVTHAAVTVMLAYTACKVVNTFSKIAVIAAKAKLR